MAVALASLTWCSALMATAGQSAAPEQTVTAGQAAGADPAAVTGQVAAAGQPVAAGQAATPQTQSEPPTDPDSIAITEVLREYRSAFGALDIERVARIWPGVDRRALGRAFARIEQQFLLFERCAITVAAPRAEARCTGNARVVPRVGGPSAQYRDGAWHFSLLQSDGRWQIQAVEATSRPSVR